ncbi:MAG: hypothetical protein AAFR17_09145 [Pseudomonadota bacterium]
MGADKDLKLLTEIGFSVTLRGLGGNMDPIFAAIEQEKPENAAGPIGRALQALVKRDFETAIDILRTKGVNAAVAAKEAQSILALALKLSGREAESRKLAAEIAGTDTNAARFAARLARKDEAEEDAPAPEMARAVNA